METKNYQIKTSYDSDLIYQDLLFGPDVIASWGLNLRESQVRETLINLGWTPPEGKARERIET